MATDIESALRGLQQVLTNVAAGSTALPSEVQRNASLRDMFGQIQGTSKAYLNLIDDDPVLYDTIIGPGGDYYEEFGQRAVVEFIVMEVKDATRDAVFSEGLAQVAKGLRLAKEQLPLLSTMDILPPERANLAAGPLPGIKAARITIEWLVTAPDMLGNILADRATATVEAILMSSDAVRDRGATLVGVIDPILSAGQVAAMLDAQLTGGVDAILSGGAAAVRLAADAAPGVADILGTGDADVLVALTGAGLIGNILGAGDASVQQFGLGGVVSIEPILGSGAASADIDGSMSGVVAAVLGSGAVFTNPGANVSGWIDPILSAGQTDVQVAAQSAGAVEALLSASAVAVNVQASASANVEAILSSGQAGQPSAVVTGSGVLEAILGAGAASLVVTNDLTGAIDPILGSGAANLTISGAGAGVVDAILSQAAADQVNQADSAANVDPIISAGAASVRATAAATASVDAILGSGAVAAKVQASSAGVIGAILGTGAGVVAGASNEAETDALIARMTVAPTATREGHINTLIKGLKDDGLWAKLDGLWVCAAHDKQAALLNWKSTSFTLPDNAGDTLVDSVGLQSDLGTSDVWDTGFSPANNGVAWDNNGAHVGLWRTKNSGGQMVALVGSTALEIFESAGAVMEGTYNAGAYSSGTVTGFPADGHVLLNAIVGATSDLYFNGSVANTGGNPGGLDAVANVVFANGLMDTIVRVAHLGGDLTGTEITNLYNRLNTFITAVAP